MALVLFLLLLLKVYIGECSHPLDSCPIKVEPVGCYEDLYHDRALTTEILNARDSSRDIYAGYSISWGNWKDYLPKFICDCAKVAFKKGFRVMGIQFYGECWGSMRGHLDYAKHGKSKNCVHDARREICCDTYYEPVGCFKDKQAVPRPLPDYVMNERDYTISNWNEHLIDWKNWNTYSPQMICRCAEKAKELGRKTFSLQFYGECWTGDESSINYAKDGNSERCLAKDFFKCPYNSYDCVGMDHANSVYTLTTEPSTAKPWSNPVKREKFVLPA
ncbi:uncharacterized protein LOC135684674 [Rhopilema esculentum]|uniref:uncharacterized protein LOC135684674 n=1 Tax=Rhopilema esculentum TaxID=499914 RepID=UPI0031E1DF9A